MTELHLYSWLYRQQNKLSWRIRCCYLFSAVNSPEEILTEKTLQRQTNKGESLLQFKKNSNCYCNCKSEICCMLCILIPPPKVVSGSGYMQSRHLNLIKYIFKWLYLKFHWKLVPLMQKWNDPKSHTRDGELSWAVIGFFFSWGDNIMSFFSPI